MVKNYLLSIFRNIARNKFYTFLNIIGLSLGMATAIFILLYVQDELAYDKHNDKYEQIHRIESDITVNNNHQQYAVVPIPIGPAMKNEFPEIDEIVRIDIIGNMLIRYEDKEYYENEFFLSDSTVFNIFSLPFIWGNPKSSLTEPNSIVITKKISEKYFGQENPLGEILTTGQGTQFKVTGVMENLPSNSHLKYDALISTNSQANEFSTEDFNTTRPSRFWRIGTFTYLLLNKNAQISDIHDKFHLFYEKYMKELGDQYNLNFELMSTPLTETHFRHGLDGERPSGNKSYIFIFSAVALFILLIAAINYMNMSTARSASRAKEIGVRKVLGAYKKQLIQQFISESLALTIIAMLLSFLLVLLVLPDFNDLAGKTLSLNFISKPILLLEIISITFFVGLISGSYPAFYLSSFVPVKVLKGAVGSSGRKGGLFRRVLVVIQFFIAIFMIVGAIVVSRQIHYLKSKDLGFTKDNLVFFELQDTAFRNKVQVFKEELLQNPNIHSVSNTTGIPGRMNWIQTMRIEQENDMEEQAIILALTDYDFVKTMNLEIIEGRNFDESMRTDALESVIINETAAYEFGWARDPIGKKIHFGYGRDGTGGRMAKVIGVVKDFHFKSLHNEIEPFIFFVNEEPEYFLMCRLNPESQAASVDFLEQKWMEFSAKHPFNFQYFENSLDEMYKEDEKVGVIIRLTTILTIVIALLGLLGLSSFIAEQKTKEIGIRKIHGATITNILFFLYKDFVRLILIAFVLAIPIAYWRLDIWLESGFVYYQPISWTTFLLAGLFALIVGLGTITFYIVRAASGNPIDAIKYE